MSEGGRPGHRGRSLRRLLARAGAIVPLALGACAAADDVRLGHDRLHGVSLDPVRARPAFTLTATDGRDFAFAERTRGQLTFLFFGYTNCPDICPVHVANIAAAISRLPFADRERAQLVFVTTDPDRDSTAALRTWLDHFDTRFVGLTGPIERIDSVQKALGLPVSYREAARPDGSYGVGHAAQVLVITEDDSLRFAYGFGTRQGDWDADLPTLLRYRRR